MGEVSGERIQPLAVGDVGVVINRARRIEAAVVKVGRRWATVEPPWLGRFDKDTRLNDGGAYPSSAQFYRPADLAHRDAMHEANEVLTEHGISFRLGAQWKDEDALALAAWLTDYFSSSAPPEEIP